MGAQFLLVRQEKPSPTLLKKKMGEWGDAAKPPRVPQILQPLVSGGAAGVVAKTVVAPLDRVKILFQTRSAHYPFFGVAKTLVRVRELEGVRGLFKGNLAMVVRIAPYAGIQFWSYEYLKKRVPRDENGMLDPSWNLVAGSIAGAVSVLATYPLDLVRVQIAVDVHGRRFRGIADAILQISRKDGVSALYRGIVPSIGGIIPYAGINFMTFDLLKRKTRELTGREHISVPEKLLCGGLAGAMGQTVAYPLDVIRRQMQSHGMADGHGHNHRSTVEALKTIVAHDGWRGLLRGVTINYMKVVPTVGISFTTYETLMKFMRGEKIRVF